MRQLSQVDKEDQEAHSQQKVSPISTCLFSSLTLNFQRIFYKKIRPSDSRNELIEAPAQDDYELLDQENILCILFDEEVDSDDEDESI